MNENENYMMITSKNQRRHQYDNVKGLKNSSWQKLSLLKAKAVVMFYGEVYVPRSSLAHSRNSKTNMLFHQYINLSFHAKGSGNISKT